MPLTEQEREWLERRKNICARCSTSYRGRPYFCGRWRYGKCIDFDPKSCIDENVDFEDAAEFEARVAVLLTDRDAPYVPPCHIVCDHRRKCRACRLMYARLAVEAEMEEKR